MIATGDAASHDEAWMALPWLASGRLSQTERDKIEPHVRTCTACREELAFQRLLCHALTEPDRVTYAPGPSFRKLMDRIDGAAPPARKSAEVYPNRARRAASGTLLRPALWRPPGLAWAASFILMIGVAGIIGTLHRSAPASYTTRSDPSAPPTVLHIAFQPTITIDEAREALRSTGAQIVEGPDSVGIFGVVPGLKPSASAAAERMSKQLRILSTRLRADPRVRWVEPIAGDDSPADAQESTSRGQ
jgi:hypothetical protein